jgi:hypothetical protein
LTRSHVYLDVGLGPGFDVRIIFGEIDLAEVERLELFGRKAAAHRVLGRAPQIAVEGLQLGPALLLDDTAKLGVEAAMAASLCRQMPRKLEVQ